jgi:hypothetical protein
MHAPCAPELWAYMLSMLKFTAVTEVQWWILSWDKEICLKVELLAAVTRRCMQNNH